MILTLANIRSEIESLFECVHPEVGDYRLSAANEPYVVYGIALKGPATPEVEAALLWKLFATFLHLRFGCAPIKPQGTPYTRDELRDTSPWTTRGSFLYWRQLPQIGEIEDGYIAISARAAISRKRVEASNLYWQDKAA